MPTELFVHPTQGDDTATGDSLHPFRTLTRALQKAKPDTLIQLSRGIYNAAAGEAFPLMVPAGVSVVGNISTQGLGVVLEGSGTYNSPSFGPQAVTVVLQDDAQLRGLTVTNPVAKGTGIWIESAAPTVVSCTLAKCGREGILVTGTANPVITNCGFQENTASGLTLVRNARGEIRNNLWRQNSFGIAISDRAAPLLTSNQILENRCGLVLSGMASPILRGNVFAQNREDGITVFGKANPDLGSQNDPAGNRFRDNHRFDVRNTTEVTLVSSGNQLNPAHVEGSVEFLTIRSPYAAPVVTSESLPAIALPAPGHAPSDLRSHWAAALIQPLLDRRIVPALSDGKFHPEATISAAELMSWLQTAGFNSVETEQTVNAQSLTRLQVIVALVKASGLRGGQPRILSGYRDRAQVPSSQTLTVTTAVQHRLVVSSSSDSLNLFALASRAEAAAMLYQTLVAKGQALAIESPQILLPNLAAAAGIQRLQAGSNRPPIVVLDPGHGGADLGVVTEVKSAEDEMMQGLPTDEMALLEMMPSAGMPMSPLPAGAMPSGMPPGMAPMISGMPSMMPPPGMPSGMSSGMPMSAGRPDGTPQMPGKPEMPSLQEKNLNLSVAQAVAGFLQQQGVQVVLTRSDDRALTLAERVEIAAQNNADVLISIHANASIARQADVNGVETYHAPQSSEAARLAWSIHKALTRIPDVADRGVRPASFYTLRKAPVPAAQIEIGYITGNQDAPSLGNLAYHRYLARAIANGILRYVSQKGR